MKEDTMPKTLIQKGTFPYLLIHYALRLIHRRTIPSDNKYELEEYHLSQPFKKQKDIYNEKLKRIETNKFLCARIV